MVAQKQQTAPIDPVREAWDRAAARAHPPGSFKAVVKDADPQSCIGALEKLVHPDGSETACPHIWESRGRVAWWVLLEQPGHLMCGKCVPGEYVELLSKPWRRVRTRCSCCQGMRWLAGPCIVQNGSGTALGLLCGECASQRSRQMVEEPW